MNVYRCWHYLCRETVMVVIAMSEVRARLEVARQLGCRIGDVVAIPVGRQR